MNTNIDKGVLDTSNETDRYESGITVTGLAVVNQSKVADKSLEDEDDISLDETAVVEIGRAIVCGVKLMDYLQ